MTNMEWYIEHCLICVLSTDAYVDSLSILTKISCGEKLKNEFLYTVTCVDGWLWLY